MAVLSALKNLLSNANSMWINDAYWLVMPFKLKDSGVTLQYVGKDTLLTGDAADRLALTFQNVGDTPDNKYHVWVDENNLIQQWAFFRSATDSLPQFITPWTSYHQYGAILLSGDRGKYQLTDIAVHPNNRPELFNQF